MPLRLRCEYAAVFPRSLPGSSCPPPREFPALNIRAGARRPQPISTRFELVPHQGGVTRRFLAYSSPSRSPNPNHLAVLARPGFVRAAPALPGTTRIRLPSAPPSCCDSISDVGLSPPFESLRFTAHPRSAPHLCIHGCCRASARTCPWWRTSPIIAPRSCADISSSHPAPAHSFRLTAGRRLDKRDQSDDIAETRHQVSPILDAVKSTVPREVGA